MTTFYNNSTITYALGGEVVSEQQINVVSDSDDEGIDHIIYDRGSQDGNRPGDDVESLGAPPGLHLNDYGSQDGNRQYGDDDESWIESPPGLRLIDGEWKSIPSWEWTDEDNAIADQIYAGSRNRYLERLSHKELIDMINMSEAEREYLIEDNM